MARCPTCEARIDHVVAETITLQGIDEIPGNLESGSKAVATLCPECEAIIGL